MAANKVSKQLGQLLVDQRLLTKDDLEEQISRAETSGVHIAKALVESGQVRPVDILRVVAERLGLRYIDPSVGLEVDLEAVRRVDRSLAVAEVILPLGFDRDGKLKVAMADPLNQQKIGLIRKAAGAEVAPLLSPSAPLKKAIAGTYDELAAASVGMPGAPAAGTADAANATAVAPFDSDDSDLHINELLEKLIHAGGSDLHLTAGSAPMMRVNGELQAIEGYDLLMPGPLRSMIYNILTSRQREELEEGRELDCSHPLPGNGRFRVNVFFQRGSVGAVLRSIPNEIMSLTELGMPEVVAEFGALNRGLVLVTGSTGSGKSTTLASLIDLINRTRPVHVMTVEDPIEFMHRHNRALVNQREVGADTQSFADALKHALRQDPDVILVGELRDLETISTALTAAETGHLVFATLHTQDAPQSVERMIDVFPPHQQQQVRIQLAGTLQGVVTQQLMPTADGKGRIAAIEVMVAIPAIRNLIREGKVHQIPSAMQAGAKHGMVTMDQSLVQLVRAGKIALKDAAERASNPDDFGTMVKGGG